MWVERKPIDVRKSWVSWIMDWFGALVNTYYALTTLLDLYIYYIYIIYIYTHVNTGSERLYIKLSLGDPSSGISFTSGQNIVELDF